MTAKPVIDLILVIRDQDSELASGLLVKRGYFHQGDLGIQGREAFGWVDGSPPPGIPYHHLYVCLENSTEWRRQLGFRDFLREHPEYVEQLSNLKWDLVREFDSDRKAYMAGKSALCEEINRKAFGDRWPQVRTDR